MCIFLTSNTIDVKVLITGIYTGTQTSAGELFKSRASHRCSEQDTTQVAIKATTLFYMHMYAYSAFHPHQRSTQSKLRMCLALFCSDWSTRCRPACCS